jgi:transcriptional regulator with XRE-family HTH domain
MQLPGLRRVREFAGLTQGELADKLDTSQDVVSKWETGRRGARPATAKRVAEKLGVSVQELAEPPEAVIARPKKVTAPVLSQLSQSTLRTLVRLIAAKTTPQMRWDAGDIIGVREDFRSLGIPPEAFAEWFATARVADVAMWLRPVPQADEDEWRTRLEALGIDPAQLEADVEEAIRVLT